MSSQSVFTGRVLPPQGANFKLADVPDDIEYRPLNFVSEDGALSKGMFYKLRGTRPTAGVHLMHPRTDQTQNYNIIPLVQAGFAVLGRAGRWPNNDVATLHEPLVLDVAVGVRYLHDEGCARVVLLGNSGGSTMATFYQSQARAKPGHRVTHTPGGEAFDLNAYDVPAADGVVLIGGHLGEGMILGKMIDGSVVDETDPLLSDPSLDLFDPANGFQPPPTSSKYDAAFLARYRAAQQERVRRIDVKAQGLVDRKREAAALASSATGQRAIELTRQARIGWHMVVYRTTADPASVDLSIDPDDRQVGSYSGKRPDLENYGPNGFARYVTPEAWLSTWSANTSRANTIDNLAVIPDPVLIVHYAGDAGARLAEVHEMKARAAAADTTLVVVRNADHYGVVIGDATNAGQRSPEGTGAVVGWMLERFGR